MADAEEALLPAEPREDAEAKKPRTALKGFAAGALAAQAALVALYVPLIRYADDADTPAPDVYPLLEDIATMLFVGFAYLMTFAKGYMYSAIGVTLLVATLSLQMHPVANLLARHAVAPFSADKGEGELSWHASIGVHSLVEADFAAAAVLISFGALLGKTTPQQMILLSIIETFAYAINANVGSRIFRAADVGGSIAIHAFGAYFGLFASRILAAAPGIPMANLAEDRTSNVFSLLGTCSLFIFWPSFTSAPAKTAAERDVIIVNTTLAIAASALTAFASSAALRGGRLDVVDIANATLAGGVAIGSVCNMRLAGPGGAIAVGCVASVLSVVGYAKLLPALESRIKLHDSCGVHNLHGMPGVLSGLISIPIAGSAAAKAYHGTYADVFPAGGGAAQMVAQASFLAFTLVFSAVAGTLTAFAMKRVRRLPDAAGGADLWFSDAFAWSA